VSGEEDQRGQHDPPPFALELPGCGGELAEFLVGRHDKMPAPVRLAQTQIGERVVSH
jgi:hypothetical protein